MSKLAIHKKLLVNTQQFVLITSVVLFIVKVAAWYQTESVAILSDALESVVNIVAALIGLYSIVLSFKPRDKEHPYGHGKIEYITSAMEGVLIAVAGLLILYEAIKKLVSPRELNSLNSGITLIAISLVVNFSLGIYAIRKGKKYHSSVLQAAGQHTITDAYSSLGILIGIFIIHLTGFNWLDSIIAIIISVIIFYNAYKIIHKSIFAIMDGYDENLVSTLIVLLNKYRQHHWIDIHNLRVINYAGFYHIDCHLTVPHYITVEEAHAIQDELIQLVKIQFNKQVEFFIHIDPCVTSQCSICAVENCHKRISSFIAINEWNIQNIITNKKHIKS